MRLGALLALVLAVSAGQGVRAETVTQARFAEPTDRYDHAILGDALEWGALELSTDAGRKLVLRLPESRVFEDLAPRLADLDGDGAPEVIVVETDLDRGARLSVYGPAGLIAATPFIGRTHRWLAPIGAADLDGDGRVEIAYVDRPHLAKVIRVWRLAQGELTLVTERAGFTNHRIGDDIIQGGIALCADGPRLVLADAVWARVMHVTLADGSLTARDAGPYTGPASLAPASAC